METFAKAGNQKECNQSYKKICNSERKVKSELSTNHLEQNWEGRRNLCTGKTLKDG